MVLTIKGRLGSAPSAISLSTSLMFCFLMAERKGAYKGEYTLHQSGTLHDNAFSS